jgi:hypothetical protein
MNNQTAAKFYISQYYTYKLSEFSCKYVLIEFSKNNEKLS